jgi:hypothetical protein
VAVLTLLATTAATPATRPTTPFTSDEYGFRLEVPADWIVPEHPDDGQVFTVWMPLRSPAAGGPATRAAGPFRVGGVGLRIEQGPPGQPDRQVVRDLTDSMAADLFADEKLAAKHVALRPATVGDLPARQVRFVVDQAGRPVAVLYVVAVRKGVEYVFNTAAPADQFDALLPDLLAMLASFDVRE